MGSSFCQWHGKMILVEYHVSDRWYIRIQEIILIGDEILHGIHVDIGWAWYY